MYRGTRAQCKNQTKLDSYKEAEETALNNMVGPVYFELFFKRQL